MLQHCSCVCTVAANPGQAQGSRSHPQLTVNVGNGERRSKRDAARS